MSMEKEPTTEAVDGETSHLGDPASSHSAASPAVCVKLGKSWVLVLSIFQENWLEIKSDFQGGPFQP